MAKQKAVKVKDVPVQVARWMDQSRHDLESARKNFGIKIYDVAILLCEQSLEKALKALISQKRASLHPEFTRSLFSRKKPKYARSWMRHY